MLHFQLSSKYLFKANEIKVRKCYEFVTLNSEIADKLHRAIVTIVRVITKIGQEYCSFEEWKRTDWLLRLYNGLRICFIAFVSEHRQFLNKFVLALDRSTCTEERVPLIVT